MWWSWQCCRSGRGDSTSFTATAVPPSSAARTANITTTTTTTIVSLPLITTSTGDSAYDVGDVDVDVDRQSLLLVESTYATIISNELR